MTDMMMLEPPPTRTSSASECTPVSAVHAMTAAFVLCAAIFLGIGPSAAQNDAPTPEERRQFMSQPQLQLKSYIFDPKTPLESRIGPCQDFLVKLMREFDDRPDYQAYEPTPEERALLVGHVQGLPQGMRKAFQERLVGLCFIKPFTGNGMASWLVDEDKNLFVNIILNPAGFEKSLSAVLTARDASLFKGDAGVKLDCGDKDKGILYTLLHEGTHAFDYIRGITPYVDDSLTYMLREGKGLDAKWDVWDGYSKPGKEADFPMRKKLKFFSLGGGPLLKPKEAGEAYRQLARSPFASLYGSQSWAEDAADMGVFYHLTQKLKQPCRVTVPGPEGSKPLRFGIMESGRTLERGRKIYGRLER
ncbi:MAG: hypothetical protein HZB91_07780 [Elusimicrobia bacterium]|nr:hypothetical protein [Elusimicrobiota bacterium]